MASHQHNPKATLGLQEGKTAFRQGGIKQRTGWRKRCMGFSALQHIYIYTHTYIHSRGLQLLQCRVERAADNLQLAPYTTPLTLIITAVVIMSMMHISI